MRDLPACIDQEKLTSPSSLGAFNRIVPRARFLEILYKNLAPDAQARILTNKKLSNIAVTETGVEVTCSDGSVHAGTIVLGADGAHSKTRQLMRDLALTQPGPYQLLPHQLNPERPWKATYRAVWCAIPTPDGFELNRGFETHGTGAALQLFSTPSSSFLFIYEKIPADHRTTTTRYTDADIQAMCDRWAHLPLGHISNVGEVLKTRTRAGMVDLDEGVLPRWSWGGRVVLAGDACHKMTPNFGFGFNNGASDAVTLVNELRRLLVAPTDVGGEQRRPLPPSRQELDDAFARYQAARDGPVRYEYDMSATKIQMSAWPSAFFWLVDRYVVGNIPGFYAFSTTMLAKNMALSPVLDFVEHEEPFAPGKIAWAHAMPAPRAGAGTGNYR